MRAAVSCRVVDTPPRLYQHWPRPELAETSRWVRETLCAGRADWVTMLFWQTQICRMKMTWRALSCPEQRDTVFRPHCLTLEQELRLIPARIAIPVEGGACRCSPHPRTAPPEPLAGQRHPRLCCLLRCGMVVVTCAIRGAQPASACLTGLQRWLGKRPKAVACIWHALVNFEWTASRLQLPMSWSAQSARRTLGGGGTP